MKEYLKRIYNQSEKKYFNELTNDLQSNRKRFIVTVNPETLMRAKEDKTLSKLLLDNKISLVPDGIAIVRVCHKIGIDMQERIAGIDIVSFLLKEGNENKKSIYLFGAKKEVIEALVKLVTEEYKDLNIVGYCDGYVKNKDKIFKNIIKLKPDICLVALGIPNQEKLIYKYINKFKKGIFVGVGGSFDVLSGMKKRAPKIFIKLNIEWLYRLVTEPARIKRFWNSNVKFMFEVKK